MDTLIILLYITGLVLVFGQFLISQPNRTLTSAIGCLLQVPYFMNMLVDGITDGSYLKMIGGAILASTLTFIGIAGVIIYRNQKN